MSLTSKNLDMKAEFLLRQGHSADKGTYSLGGAHFDEEKPRSNSMPGLAFGSQIAWTLSEEGAYVGPPENKQGNLVRHSPCT